MIPYSQRTFKWIRTAIIVAMYLLATICLDALIIWYGRCVVVAIAHDHTIENSRLHLVVWQIFINYLQSRRKEENNCSSCHFKLHHCKICGHAPPTVTRPSVEHESHDAEI